MKPTIAIIGGYGGMGKFFAELFSKEGYSVIITGPDKKKGETTAKEIKAIYEKDNTTAAKKADVVIVSVPMNSTIEVIKEVAPNMREGSLLMDFTSIKEEPCKIMQEYAPEGVEVIGTHPVFSHRVGSIEGQVFIVTPIRGEKWINWLKSFLIEHKARIYETTPKEHDETMAVVQGLTHFAYISIGKTLEEMDFDIKKSRNFASPIYELMLDMVGRILGQNPELYSSIQIQNPRTIEVHKRFINVAKKLSKAIEEKDEKTFKEIMSSAARHFDDVERAMGRSDKAIASLATELTYLKNSIGKELCLQHIYSGQIHVGKIKSVSADWVTLDDAGRESRLNLMNIRILNDKERIEYKKKKYGTAKRDFSFVVDEGIDENFLATLLYTYDENITRVEVKDVYSGPNIGEHKKSICFGVEIINSEIKKTEKKITEFLTKLGGKLR